MAQATLTQIVAELGCLAAMAWVAASTVGAVVESALWLPPPERYSGARPRSTPPTLRPKLELNRIAALTGLPVPGASAELPPEVDRSLAPVPTTLPLRLLGTLVAQSSELSLAAIEDLRAGDSASYGVGEAIGSARVLAIEPSRVLLLVDGRREFLEPSPLPARPTGPPVAAPTLSRAGAAPTSPLGSTIRALSADTFDVPRDELARVLSNLNTLATKARVLPAFRNGQSIGFKLFSIRPDSLYTRIGLRNGDVIRRINGLDLNSPEKALEAYTRMKDSTRIDLEVERGGHLLRHTYHIR